LTGNPLTVRIARGDSGAQRFIVWMDPWGDRPEARWPSSETNATRGCFGLFRGRQTILARDAKKPKSFFGFFWKGRSFCRGNLLRRRHFSSDLAGLFDVSGPHRQFHSAIRCVPGHLQNDPTMPNESRRGFFCCWSEQFISTAIAWRASSR